jgi:hypothetical protein
MPYHYPRCSGAQTRLDKEFNVNSSIATFAAALASVILTHSRKTETLEFSYCEAEYNRCTGTCQVQLQKGKKLGLGSYVKVIHEGRVIDEGYVLKHVNGSVFILKKKSDAKNPELCGGCCDGTLSIDIEARQIWGC